MVVVVADILGVNIGVLASMLFPLHAWTPPALKKDQ